MDAAILKSTTPRRVFWLDFACAAPENAQIQTKSKRNPNEIHDAPDDSLSEIQTKSRTKRPLTISNPVQIHPASTPLETPAETPVETTSASPSTRPDPEATRPSSAAVSLAPWLRQRKPNGGAFCRGRGRLPPCPGSRICALREATRPARWRRGFARSWQASECRGIFFLANPPKIRHQVRSS